MIYVACFLLVSILILCSSRREHKNKKMVVMLPMLAALLLPCMLAGLRSYSVGTDVEVYARNIFEKASTASSYGSFLQSGWDIGWKIRKVSEYETGFTTLIYIAARVFSNFHVALFLIQLFTIVPIFLGLKNIYEDKRKICIGMLVYLLMFFCMSLNLMRQMIGVAICFYGVSFILREKKNYIAAIMAVVVATLFHKTSIIALFSIFAYRLLSSRAQGIKIGKGTINTKTIMLIITLVIGAIILFVPGVAMMLLEESGYGRYSGYIGNTIGLSVSQLIMRIPLILLLIIHTKKDGVNNRTRYFYLIMAIMDALLVNAATASIYGSRLSIVFQIFYIASVPFAIDKSQKAKGGAVKVACAIMYFMSYWYINYVVYNVGQVVPYSFY